MPFVPVTWNDNELIEASKLNQMCDNIDYLYDRIPQFDITSSDGSHSAGQLFIQAGYHDVFSGSYTTSQEGRIVTADVVFPTPFRYRPIISVDYISEDINWREVAVMVGSKNGSKQPDKDGFKVHLTHNKGSAPFQTVQGKYYVHFVALGIKV